MFMPPIDVYDIDAHVRATQLDNAKIYLDNALPLTDHMNFLAKTYKWMFYFK